MNSFRQENFGQEQSPILITDDFSSRPEKLIDQASEQNFFKTGPLYPGVRSPAANWYVDLPREKLPGLLGDTFHEFSGFSVEESYFSVVTTPRVDLQLQQCLPHFDGPDPRRLAILHYLSPDTYGGTSFFRHDATGFETICQSRINHYNAQLRQEIAKQVPERSYPDREPEFFTEVFHTPAIQDRLVVYRGQQLHSGVIPDDCPLVADPHQGRLTLNSFVYLYA